MTQALFNFIGALIWLLAGIWLFVASCRAGSKNKNSDGWRPGFIVNSIFAAMFALTGFAFVVIGWVEYGKMLEVCK